MASFYAKWLVTNVPIEGAVHAVLREQDSDPGLAERTMLTPAQITSLLNFVLRSSYFHIMVRFKNNEIGTHGNPIFRVYYKSPEKKTFEGQPTGACFIIILCD